MLFSPRIITIIPAAVVIIRLNPPISSRVPEKRILSTTKTALKPRIKLTVTAINRGRGAAPSVVSAEGAAPPRKQNQDGIRGSTQGDKKENNPATKDRNKDTFAVI
jgi:hypothetical protein